MASFTPQQIEEFLQEFFDVVGTRQYIGARYVPLFGRRGDESVEWDNSAPYEPLTIVTYMGNSYTSRTYVPAGVSITDGNYWVNTGNYNTQIEQYRQEVINYSREVEAVSEQLDTLQGEIEESSTFPPFDTNTILMFGGVSTTVNNVLDEGICVSRDGINFAIVNKPIISDVTAAGNAKNISVIDDTVFLFDDTSHYTYTTDFVDYYRVPISEVYEQTSEERVWNVHLVNVDDATYLLCSYSPENLTTQGAFGMVRSNFSVKYIPCTVTDGQISYVGPVSEWNTIELGSDSYIDPDLTYFNNQWILAVKNEVKSIIEVYSSNYPFANYSLTPFTHKCYGIEAPKLVAYDDSLFCYADGYALTSKLADSLLSGTTQYVGIPISVHSILFQVIKDGAYMSDARLNLVNVPYCNKHQAFVRITNRTVLKQLSKNLSSEYQMRELPFDFDTIYNAQYNFPANNQANPVYAITNCPWVSSYAVNNATTRTFTLAYDPAFVCEDFKGKLLVATPSPSQFTITKGTGINSFGGTTIPLDYDGSIINLYMGRSLFLDLPRATIADVDKRSISVIDRARVSNVELPAEYTLMRTFDNLAPGNYLLIISAGTNVNGVGLKLEAFSTQATTLRQQSAAPPVASNRQSEVQLVLQFFIDTANDSCKVYAHPTAAVTNLYYSYELLRLRLY